MVGDKMAQWGNALATKPDSLSSTSGTNTVGNNQRSQTVRPLFVHPDNSMHTNIHIQIDRQTHTHTHNHTHTSKQKNVNTFSY